MVMTMVVRSYRCIRSCISTSIRRRSSRRRVRIGRGVICVEGRRRRLLLLLEWRVISSNRGCSINGSGSCSIANVFIRLWLILCRWGKRLSLSITIIHMSRRAGCSRSRRGMNGSLLLWGWGLMLLLQ